jgi:hypothetical protein
MIDIEMTVKFIYHNYTDDRYSGKAIPYFTCGIEDDGIFETLANCDERHVLEIKEVKHESK